MAARSLELGQAAKRRSWAAFGRLLDRRPAYRMTEHSVALHWTTFAPGALVAKLISLLARGLGGNSKELFLQTSSECNAIVQRLTDLPSPRACEAGHRAACPDGVNDPREQKCLAKREGSKITP